MKVAILTLLVAYAFAQPASQIPDFTEEEIFYGYPPLSSDEECAVDNPWVKEWYVWNPVTDTVTEQILPFSTICVDEVIQGNIEGRLCDESVEDTTDVFHMLFKEGDPDVYNFYRKRKEIQVPYMVWGDDANEGNIDIFAPGAGKPLSEGNYFLASGPFRPDIKEDGTLGFFPTTDQIGPFNFISFSVSYTGGVSGASVWSNVTNTKVKNLMDGDTFCVPNTFEYNIAADSCGDDDEIDVYLELLKYDTTTGNYELFRKRREDKFPYLVWGDADQSELDVFPSGPGKILDVGYYMLVAQTYEQGIKETDQSQWTPIGSPRTTYFSVSGVC